MLKHRSDDSRITDERTVRGGRRLALELDIGRQTVPGAFLIPDAPRPAPAALLIHGYSSRKERMTETIGGALLARGVASLALDLPLHGARATDRADVDLRNPLAVARQWRMAVDESTTALHWLERRPEVDGMPLGVIGYSLGSYLAVLLAARDPRIRAVVVAAGGDLPALGRLDRLVRAAVDPLKAVKRLDGRPLLVVHGRWDRTVRPEQAERLFAAAPEPKQIRWYDAGHWLPERAIEEGAEWMARELTGALGVARARKSG